MKNKIESIIMKFNVIFGFITIAVLFSTSSASTTPNIIGSWYVHEVNGGVWVHHPTIQNWNFTITESSEVPSLKGVSVYTEAETNENIVANFEAELYPQAGGDIYRVHSPMWNNIFLLVQVNAHGEGLTWTAVDEDGFSFGTMVVYRQPKVTRYVGVWFDDDDGFVDDVSDMNDNEHENEDGNDYSDEDRIK